jgi:hypothetical protein
VKQLILSLYDDGKDFGIESKGDISIVEVAGLLHLAEAQYRLFFLEEVKKKMDENVQKKQGVKP